MARIYIIYYDFSNTSGNHTGMSYLCKLLADVDRNIVLIKNLNQNFLGSRYFAKLYAAFLAIYLYFKIKKDDKIVFFEYLTKNYAHQDLTANIIRALGIQNKCLGLVHLSGSHLLELYRSKNELLLKLNYLDGTIVLGSSLASFLKNINYKKNIYKTFHYVDTNFYKPNLNYSISKPIQVFSIGNIKRNFEVLYDIIVSCPLITFNVCFGKFDVPSKFTSLANIKIFNYLSEQDLLILMKNCDISLSVLEDTVGSNAITTSLSVGLAQIVSDVGSIRDYCNESNSYFCKTTDEFIFCINSLVLDREKLLSMKISAIKNAKVFSIEKFYDEFFKIIYE